MIMDGAVAILLLTAFLIGRIVPARIEVPYLLARV
jgi:hypothetical protein